MNDVQQDLTVGDINSGGGPVNVTQQVAFNQDDGPQRGWPEALLRGPIAALNLETDLAEARRLAEAGNSQAAADALVGLARQLDRDGYESSADYLLFQAATELAKDSPKAADERRLAIARRQIDRADPQAQILAQQLAHDSPHLPPELTALLWNVNVSQSPSDGEIQSAAAVLTGRPDECWWRARLTEMAYLGGQYDRAVEVSEPLRESQALISGDRLLLELDALAAQEALYGADGVEAQWEALLRWADTAATANQDRGLVYQRYGTVLAYRDDLDGADAAYLTAARAFASSADGQEQAASALFSQRRAVFLLGDPMKAVNDLTVAVGLRGRTQSPAATGDRLTRIALHRLTDKSLREALFSAQRALRVQHRCGDLMGIVEAFHILGRVNETIADGDDGTEHDRLSAIHFAIRAGDHKWAADQAHKLTNPQHLPEVLMVDGARWERAASYTALKSRGQQIPEPTYSELAEIVLDEAALEPFSIYGNDVRRLARQALARFPFLADDELRGRILATLEKGASEGTIEDIHSARVALRQAHECGFGNYQRLLLDDYLSDVPSRAVTPDTAPEIFDDPDSIERLVEAAHEGRRAALEALCASGEAALYPDLVQTCEDQVEATLELETHGPGRLDMIDLSSEGLYARMVDEPLRGRLTVKLLELISDGEDSRDNRHQALAALWQLSDHLTPTNAALAFDVVAEVARGQAPASAFDDEADASRHPLHFFRRFQTQADELEGLAVRVAANLAAMADDKTEPMQEIIDSALHSPHARIRTAALAALADHQDLRAPEHLRLGEDRWERAAQLQLQLARRGIPPLVDLKEVFEDPEFIIRRVLLNVAEKSQPPRTDVLERIAAIDPDAYLRAAAQERLRWLCRQADASDPGTRSRPAAKTSSFAAIIKRFAGNITVRKPAA